jgi:hypothetical protein
MHSVCTLLPHPRWHHTSSDPAMESKHIGLKSVRYLKVTSYHVSSLSGSFRLTRGISSSFSCVRGIRLMTFFLRTD